MKPTFRTSRVNEPDNSAWRLYRIKDTIQTDPEYQRSSDIWPTEKKQLLIDTILNGFDVPKLYFHKFSSPILMGDSEYEYAIIDGKQRLEAIWGFIDGKFALSSDFECLWDASMAAAGMTYLELSKNYPDLKTALDSYPLTIVCIETDDIEIIEDMFSRLNESAPLSAAEKRNAKGGPIPSAIKSLTGLTFFQEKLPFGNSRYRHYDLAVKFLFTAERGKVMETKKRSLDRYVEEWAKGPRQADVPSYEVAKSILEEMAAVFTSRDKLLRQVGSVILYFHVFRIARAEGWTSEIERRLFEEFERTRDKNYEKANSGDDADLDLLEFDRFAQSSNDVYAVKIRLRLILKYVFGRDTLVENL
jgi:hypothetical protein